MITYLKNEAWKPFRFKGYKNSKYYYTISNYGRIASFRTNLEADGKILKGSQTAGYRTLNLNIDDVGTLYLHRYVAILFLPKPLKNQKYVIHLNHIKDDNRVENLKWVSLEEMILHQQNSPATKAYRKEQSNKIVGPKLNAEKVRTIKKVLANEQRKITIAALAAKYGVSEMTMYRIQSGENWGHIKI